ncbi:MAG: hypothetical protein ACJ75J_11235 [Cytophagaceae bacterium]
MVIKIILIIAGLIGIYEVFRNKNSLIKAINLIFALSIALELSGSHYLMRGSSPLHKLALILIVVYACVTNLSLKSRLLLLSTVLFFLEYLMHYFSLRFSMADTLVLFIVFFCYILLLIDFKKNRQETGFILIMLLLLGIKVYFTIISWH